MSGPVTCFTMAASWSVLYAVLTSVCRNQIRTFSRSVGLFHRGTVGSYLWHADFFPLLADRRVSGSCRRASCDQWCWGSQRRRHLSLGLVRYGNDLIWMDRSDVWWIDPDWEITLMDYEATLATWADSSSAADGMFFQFPSPSLTCGFARWWFAHLLIGGNGDQRV